MKGFTLIELLAVIIILALILVIAVPQINNTIIDSKKKSFVSDAKIVLNELDINEIDESIDILSVNETNIESILGIQDDNYESVKLTKVNGDPYILVKGKNKWSGLIVYGTYNNMTVGSETNYNTISYHMGYNTEKGVNEPVLSKGMTPIKWDGAKWISTTEDDGSWYDYTNKKWANAKTEDGSMWVWIPRYIYKISSGWHSSTLGTIDVKFSIGTDDTIGGTITLDTGTTSNASNNKWTNHPGFKFGNTELNGIWVAKFEPSATEGVANGYTDDGSCPITGDNVTTKTIKVIPNVASWRCISIGNAYSAIRGMETKNVYGWDVANTLKSDGTYTTDSNNVDTHLMKNVEWGAVAYLSRSTYGKNTEVWINNSLNYTTGCAGNSTSEAGYTGCQNTYESTNGVESSTTGNIYGIYDTRGSAWEMTSAYLNNANTNLTTYGSSILNANSIYKDVYTVSGTDSSQNNYLLAVNKKGDSVYETSSSGAFGPYTWGNYFSVMVYNLGTFFIRGGASSSYNIYTFNTTSGTNVASMGFRPVLLVGPGL